MCGGFITKVWLIINLVFNISLLPGGWWVGPKVPSCQSWLSLSHDWLPIQEPTQSHIRTKGNSRRFRSSVLGTGSQVQRPNITTKDTPSALTNSGSCTGFRNQGQKTTHIFSITLHCPKQIPYLATIGPLQTLITGWKKKSAYSYI